MKCPCYSGKQYAECCSPFHHGQNPETALQLMRSRYAAYALNLPAYIIETTHLKNPQFCSDAEQWAQQISTFALSTEFENLEILEFFENGSMATVTFRAGLARDHKDISFTETSRFERVEGKWLYYSGQIH